MTHVIGGRGIALMRMLMRRSMVDGQCQPGHRCRRVGCRRIRWAWLRRHDERVCSFVDATSFVVMRRERVGEVLAFDGHFSAAGFIEVRP